MKRLQQAAPDLMQRSTPATQQLSRRRFLARAGGIGLMGLLGALAWEAMAVTPVELPFVNGRRELVTNFPQKAAMLLQRTRPPLLETPFEVFDQGVFTPNDRFYVRWHLANIPSSVDPATFRLNIRGHVRQPISLTLDELIREFEPFEIAAVNQCSGNSRAFFSPRVAGGQWANGAMGNALWKGVRLKDVLDRAGVNAGAVQASLSAATVVWQKSCSAQTAGAGGRKRGSGRIRANTASVGGKYRYACHRRARRS